MSAVLMQFRWLAGKNNSIFEIYEDVSVCSLLTAAAGQAGNCEVSPSYNGYYRKCSVSSSCSVQESGHPLDHWRTVILQYSQGSIEPHLCIQRIVSQGTIF